MNLSMIRFFINSSATVVPVSDAPNNASEPSFVATDPEDRQTKSSELSNGFRHFSITFIIFLTSLSSQSILFLVASLWTVSGLS